MLIKTCLFLFGKWLLCNNCNTVLV